MLGNGGSMAIRGDAGKLVAAVVGTELVGAASAFAAGRDMREFFDALRKPPLTPPAAVFGPAWATLYLLMGVAAWLIWRQGIDQQSALALGLFATQLLLNALWSILFFGARRTGWALLEIGLLWLAILATIVAFWRVQPLAAALLLPYLAWVSFAAYLNAGIVRLN
jgi:translocator protein